MGQKHTQQSHSLCRLGPYPSGTEKDGTKTRKVLAGVPLKRKTKKALHQIRGVKAGASLSAINSSLLAFAVINFRGGRGGGGGGGQSSSVGSVLGSLSCVMQRRGFDPPLRLP